MMMKLSRADIAPLIKLSESKIAEWLQSGFEDAVSGDESRAAKAFYPLHLLLPQSPSIVDDFQAIYDALPDAKIQAKFRKGLKKSFDYLSFKGNSPDALRDILAIAQRIGSYELAECIVPMICNTGSYVNAPQLFGHALNYLSMISPLPSAKDAILELISSERFDCNYSVQAFISLCRCDPVHWIGYLGKLRALIAKAREGKNNKNAVLTAKRFASVVPLKSIAENVLCMEVINSGADHRHGDNWLAEALFCSPNSPLGIRENEHGWWEIYNTKDVQLSEHIPDAQNARTNTVAYLRSIKDKPSRDVSLVVQRVQAIRNKSTKGVAISPKTEGAIRNLLKWETFALRELQPNSKLSEVKVRA